MPPESNAHDENTKTHSPLLWCDDGWTAKIIKNEDDEGWAVAMTADGAREPALVGPWTMGRNKKDPKPLDAFAFSTLVKTATEFVGRQQQQQRAALHKNFTVDTASGRITVAHDIIPDEDNPSATLTATNELGESLAEIKVSPAFKLTRASAAEWVANSFAKPKSASE
jgi:Cu/Ag efflux protein CusF